MCWIYFTYTSGKQLIKNNWKGEAQLPTVTVIGCTFCLWQLKQTNLNFTTKLALYQQRELSSGYGWMDMQDFRLGNPAALHCYQWHEAASFSQRCAGIFFYFTLFVTVLSKPKNKSADFPSLLTGLQCLNGFYPVSKMNAAVCSVPHAGLFVCSGKKRRWLIWCKCTH